MSTVYTESAEYTKSASASAKYRPPFHYNTGSILQCKPCLGRHVRHVGRLVTGRYVLGIFLWEKYAKIRKTETLI